MIRARPCALAAIIAGILSSPAPAGAWGASAQKVITTKAVDTLPPELREFFEAHKGMLALQSAEPLESQSKIHAAERLNHYIYLDRYGRFPFDALPRDYKSALRTFGKSRIDANGVLPWQVGVYSDRLASAMRAGKWDEARQLAATLAYYVAATHDPFNTTDNSDGQLSGQNGVRLRFGLTLVDRFSLFFFVRPNDAAYISQTSHDRAFESCLSAHSWLENILLADRRARSGLPDYTDEYYDRFYNQTGAILIRQISEAAADVGSFWLTAWINAGRPALPAR